MLKYKAEEVASQSRPFVKENLTIISSNDMNFLSSNFNAIVKYETI